MRRIDWIIVHCTATKEGRPYSLADIRAWHRARGWRDIGYHYVIDLEGRVLRGRAEAEVGAHCKGMNAHSIGICYVGGLDKQGRPKDTRTPAQKQALKSLLHELCQKYPHAKVAGHRQFAPKACPCFEVGEG